MAGIVPFITQCMFLKSRLPDTAPAMADAGNREGFFRTAERQPGLSVVFFNRAPTFGIIGVVRRQGPDGVQVIVQHNHRIHPERRPAVKAIPKRRP